MGPETIPMIPTTKPAANSDDTVPSELWRGENSQKRARFQKAITWTSITLNLFRKVAQITGATSVPLAPMQIEQRVTVRNENLSALWRTKGDN